MNDMRKAAEKLEKSQTKMQRELHSLRQGYDIQPSHKRATPSSSSPAHPPRSVASRPKSSQQRQQKPAPPPAASERKWKKGTPEEEARRKTFEEIDRQRVQNAVKNRERCMARYLKK